MSSYLQPHGLQHTSFPCPSLSSWVCSDSSPLGWWCCLTLSCSAALFSCLPSFPASGSFPVSQFFTSSGQSIGASVSALVLLMNIQDWSPLGWTGWISLQSQGLSRVLSTPQVKSTSSSGLILLYGLILISIHDHWKTIALTRWTFVGRVMSLLFNMLSRLVITFLPRGNLLLISRLQSPSAMILEPKKIKSVTFYGFSIYLP